MKNLKDEYSFLNEEPVKPSTVIIGIAIIIIAVIALCVFVWNITHTSEEESIEDTLVTTSTMAKKDEYLGKSGETWGSNIPSKDSAESGTGSASQVQIGGSSDGSGSMSAGSGDMGTTSSEMEFNEVEDTVTALDMTNLRSVPSTQKNETILYQLHNGENAKRTGINDATGWSRLEYDGVVVYAVTRYLKKVEKESTSNTNTSTTPEQSTDAIDTAETANVEEVGTPENSSSETEATQSSTSQETSTANKNEVTTYDGRVVYFTDIDDTVSPKYEVNLRGEPSTSQGNATIHFRLPYGENVHRTGISEEMGWSRVEYNGEILYLVTNYIYVVE